MAQASTFNTATHGATRFSLLSAFRTWIEVSRQRAALGRLDAHLLKDAGLLESDQLRESRRAFWDV